MAELLQMWAFVEVLGFVCLPLTVTVFHNLPDRGWAFSKAIGIAVLAFCVWLPLMLFHALFFNQFLVAGVFLILLAFNIVGFIQTRHTILKIVRVNFSYIIISEAVFGGMMFLLGWIRSYVPDIRSFEMFMDEGFIAAIMRSPHFPPNDMWFSGYPINYYYYAHFTVGVLAKLLGQSPSIAFNTGICTFFGLTAVNLFGVTSNIVSWAQHQRKTARLGGDAVGAQFAAPRPAASYPSLMRAVPYGFLTMLMALVLGNLAATQQWWEQHGDWTQFNWFNPSRVVDRTINEFPAFSFLLSCFHAHVLALAFTILAIALAFNLFLEHEGKGLFVFGRGWRLPVTMVTTALILGGLFTMNGWDFPTYVGLTVVCIVLQQWLAYRSREGGEHRLELLLDIFTACASLIALSFILYIPFYLNYISPSQGLGIVGPADRSSLSSEILIYGMFAFVFLSLLLAKAFKHPFFSMSNTSTSEIPSSHATARIPLLNVGVKFAAPLLVAVAALITFFVLRNSATFVLVASIAALGFIALLGSLRDRPQAFILLLGSLAFTLVAACEVVFLKDVFAGGDFLRMNTVFKFYFQAWALLSITCGTGLYFIMESFPSPVAIVATAQRWLQRGVGSLWVAGLLLLLLASAVYPLVGTYARTNHYMQRANSLDGIDYLQNCKVPDCDYNTSGDYAAIRWLNSHVSGAPVIVEAVGDDYSSYARISAFTGLPTPMGWIGHEYQWRVNWLNNGLHAVDFDSRKSDVDAIYTDPHPAVVMNLLARYHVQYLYVGLLEQMKYPTADLHRFSAFLHVVYSARDVTIYQVN
jgi:YYY domain-containing protein